MFGSRNFLFAKAAGGVSGSILFSWGYNGFGGLGLGNITNYSSPKQVGALIDWAYPSISYNNSTLCNKTDGTLWAWGNGVSGVLGTGNTTSRSSPVQVGSLATWGKPTVTGVNASLCIKTDGTLWSWGESYYGTTAQGNQTSLSSPVQVGSLTNWSKLSQSTFYTVLCVKTNGTLFAWGGNYFGQVGDGTTTVRSSPVQVGALTTWANPSVGRIHSLCVKTDGTLWTWGRNNFGQLGLGDITSRSSPVQVGALTNWSKPTGGTNFSGCVKTDGTLWTWGRNVYGQLGLGNTTNYSSPKQVGALTTWSEARCGTYQMAAVKTTGELWTWGRNNLGQLGQGDTVNRSSPVQIGSSTTWQNPAASSAVFCTKQSPTAAPVSLTVPVISGTAQEGQTLTSTTGTWDNDPASFTFQWQRGTSNIGGATSSTYLIVSADIGSTLRCVVTATNGIGATSANSANTGTVMALYGKLFSWGSNYGGALGDGTATDRSSPVQIGALTTWATPNTSSFCCIATKSDGTLWSWGYNSNGQLGLGDVVNRSSPVQIGALTNWDKPSGGTYGSACIKTDGTLWTWGKNNVGQLGLGNTTNRSSPVQVGALTNWTEINCGGEMMVAINNGKLFAWGNNSYGRLGLGNTTNYSSPVQIGALTTWKKPTAGNETNNGFVLCTKTDGTLWTWGRNNFGQLGLGNTTNYSSPKQIGSLTTWDTPTAGWVSALCTKTDGTLWSWGRNQNGQLGLGNTTNYSSPKQIGSLTNWLIPTAGKRTSLCIKTDGTLWSWGYNNYGVLGLGNAVPFSSPVQVGALSSWIKVSTDASTSIATRS